MPESIPPEAPAAPLAVAGLRHAYGQTPVLDGLDLWVDPGELVAVLGASGSGKTTLLRAVAGLLAADGGEIEVAGRRVASQGQLLVPAEQRGVGLVFQDYALFPHMSVADNVGFGLRPRNPARVAELLAAVGLAELANRRPAELSGGQQQRVALARAVAPRPALVLLDEPFANVDAELTATLAAEMRRLLAGTAGRSTGVLLVTHDRDSAMAMADRLVLIEPRPQGSVVAQQGPPDQVYARPASKLVARLTGPCWFTQVTARGRVATSPHGDVELVAEARGLVDVCVRPHGARFQLRAAGSERVLSRRFVGRGWLLGIWSRSGPLTVEWPGGEPPPLDSRGDVRIVEPCAVVG